MLSETAFLPPNDVIHIFEELVDHLRNAYNGDADNLLEYFEDTYIGRYRRNAPRRQPTFPIQLWNMFHRTENELHRTNNSVFKVTYHRVIRISGNPLRCCRNRRP